MYFTLSIIRSGYYAFGCLSMFCYELMPFFVAVVNLIQKNVCKEEWGSRWLNFCLCGLWTHPKVKSLRRLISNFQDHKCEEPKDGLHWKVGRLITTNKAPQLYSVVRYFVLQICAIENAMCGFAKLLLFKMRRNKQLHATILRHGKGWIIRAIQIP